MITLEAFNQQIEITKLYTDDKFVGLMKKCRDLLKEAADAQTALDVREKAVARTKREAEVVLNSQETFNGQREKAEARNLADQQHNQRTKDAVLADRKNVDADRADAAEFKAAAEAMLADAEKKLKHAESKNKKADAALQTAEVHKKAYAERLEQLGLKAA